MWRSTLAINAKAEANMHSSLKINVEGAAVTGASNGAGRGPSYVAFKIPFASLEVAWGTGGHINVDATLPSGFLRYDSPFWSEVVRSWDVGAGGVEGFARTLSKSGPFPATFVLATSSRYVGRSVGTSGDFGSSSDVRSTGSGREVSR